MAWGWSYDKANLRRTPPVNNGESPAAGNCGRHGIAHSSECLIGDERDLRYADAGKLLGPAGHVESFKERAIVREEERAIPIERLVLNHDWNLIGSLGQSVRSVAESLRR
jgi:hypothetical protein